MIRARNIFSALFTVGLVCATARAQVRSGVASAGARAVPEARLTIRTAPAFRQARTMQGFPSGQNFSTSASSIRFVGVPGLGFDHPHLAAIRGGLRNGLSSNSGRGHHHGQGTFVPIVFFGGYPYYLGDPGYVDDYDDSYVDPSSYQQPEQPIQQQPQVIVIQQPVPVAQQPPDTGNEVAAADVPPPAAPVPEVGEFVLVRQDGRVLFASAYSVTGTQLHYITPEGIRRTLPLSDLDSSATQQMNEARGSTVQIQN